MRKAEWILLGMVAVAVATGLVFYPYLPTMVASHWDAAGNVNGSLSRAWGTFLFPAIFFALFLVFFAIPRIDPKRENIRKFRKYFDYFIVGFGAFFYYIYFLTLLWNVGYRFDMTTFILPPVSALFYFIGIFLPHTKVNWTIGIRTPWTISSASVWKKTHEAGGVAFKMSGIIGLVGTAFPPFGVWFLLVPVIASTIGLVVYSYVLYEKEHSPS